MERLTVEERNDGEEGARQEHDRRRVPGRVAYPQQTLAVLFNWEELEVHPEPRRLAHTLSRKLRDEAM